MAAKPNDGWAKIAFTHAIKYLKDGMGYYDALSTHKLLFTHRESSNKRW